MDTRRHPRRAEWTGRSRTPVQMTWARRSAVCARTPRRQGVVSLFLSFSIRAPWRTAATADAIASRARGGRRAALKVAHGQRDGTDLLRDAEREPLGVRRLATGRLARHSATHRVTAVARVLDAQRAGRGATVAILKTIDTTPHDGCAHRLPSRIRVLVRHRRTRVCWAAKASGADIRSASRPLLQVPLAAVCPTVPRLRKAGQRRDSVADSANYCCPVGNLMRERAPIEHATFSRSRE